MFFTAELTTIYDNTHTFSPGNIICEKDLVKVCIVVYSCGSSIKVDQIKSAIKHVPNHNVNQLFVSLLLLLLLVVLVLLACFLITDE